LAKAVHTTGSLFVASGVPAEVVMDNGVEEVLKVDAFAEAVGADKHVFGCGFEFLDFRFAFRGWSRSSHGHDFGLFGESVAKFGGKIFGSGDEPAENDRTMAFGEELLDVRYGF